MDATSELGQFLTSRRAKLAPEQAGLPTFGRRQVEGLRREEVASLAGVSVECYKRLERGNAAGVSDGVLDALSDALQPDDAERTHLFDLVRAAGRVAPPRQRAAGGRSCSASSTPSAHRRRSATRAATTCTPTRSAGRSTPRCSTAPSSRPTARASRSSIRGPAVLR